MPAAGVVTAIALLAALPAQACWEAAAVRYGVSSELPYAIARTESALDPQAVGRNRNGTRDIGLMQINSAWLPTLAAHGIGERDLYRHASLQSDGKNVVDRWRQISTVRFTVRSNGTPPIDGDRS
jgi:soluble lytic murein transglycosylase-like protein